MVRPSGEIAGYRIHETESVCAVRGEATTSSAANRVLIHRSWADGATRSTVGERLHSTGNVGQTVVAEPGAVDSGPRSELEVVQVPVAHPGAVQRVGRVVVLDEEVLHARLLLGREKSREVDLTTTDVDHLVVGCTTRILDMYQREASGVTAEVVERIGAGSGYPVQVELEVDQLGIGVVEQHVENATTLDLPELGVVVVERQPDLERLCVVGGGVHQLRGALERIDRVARVLGERRDHEPLLSHLGGFLQGAERSEERRVG